MERIPLVSRELNKPDDSTNTCIKSLESDKRTLEDRVQILEKTVSELVKKNIWLEGQLTRSSSTGTTSRSEKENFRTPTPVNPNYKPRLAISSLISNENNTGSLNRPSGIKYRLYIGEPSYTHFYVIKMEQTVNTSELLRSLIKHMNLKVVDDFCINYAISEFSDEVTLEGNDCPTELLQRLTPKREDMEWPRLYLKRRLS